MRKIRKNAKNPKKCEKSEKIQNIQGFFSGFTYFLIQKHTTGFTILGFQGNSFDQVD